MLRKLALVGAVTLSLGLGAVGTAAAEPVPPLPVIDNWGCEAEPLRCHVLNPLLAILIGIATGSTDGAGR